MENMEILLGLLDWTGTGVFAQASSLKEGFKNIVETVQMFSALLCLVAIVGGAVAYATGNVERALHLLIAAGVFGMAWMITSYFFDIGGSEVPF